MEKATIFEYARMCGETEECSFCPLNLRNNGTNFTCNMFIVTYPDKANEIILNWCKEHQIKTRQSEFLKMFPNARTDVDGVLSICPQFANKDFSCQTSEKRCSDCCKEYWLAEVDE